MNHRKCSPSSPPTAWVSLLLENHQMVHRVRMMWRRGKVPYRPLVPEHLNVDELTEDEWIEYELPETHFEWSLETPNSPTARREAIREIVGELWDIASRWTRSRGEWCDFQLIGFDDEGDELFAVGRRLKLDDEPTPTDRDSDDDDDVVHDASWSPRMTHAPTATISPEWRELHRSHTTELKEIIDYTKTDRDDALSRSRQTLDDNQRLWRQAHEASQLANQVLRETVGYERQQAEQIRQQNSGRFKLQAHAVSEMERSARFGQTLEFLKYGWDSAMANVVPVAARLIETLGGDRVAKDFPEFRWAQQAMAYLVIALTPTQLDMMFDKDRKAAGAFLGKLDQAASMKNEREALGHVTPLVRFLRAERFRDIADPEQQIAARFIINRMAMYRMVEYGEDDVAGATEAG